MLNISCRIGGIISCALVGVFFMYSSCAMTAEMSNIAAASANASTVVRPENSANPVSSKTLGSSQNLYFKRNWGVEVIGIHPVSSGYMLNFRYRIVDPVKAKSLNDMKSKAYVIDDATGTRLAVPAMEKVGELRSGATPQVGREYFMIFGNPGKLVKPGGSVTVVIGNFHVDSLLVN